VGQNCWPEVGQFRWPLTIGRRVDLRIPSGGDMDVAQGAGGWNFVRYRDGTFGGVNGNTGVIYMYEGGSWNPTGDRY
jgi:hypothetical protein